MKTSLPHFPNCFSKRSGLIFSHVNIALLQKKLHIKYKNLPNLCKIKTKEFLICS